VNALAAVKARLVMIDLAISMVLNVVFIIYLAVGRVLLYIRLFLGMF